MFGSGKSAVQTAVEAVQQTGWSDNAGQSAQTAALNAFAAEFVKSQRGFFDRLMDGLNRVPRPAMAFSTLGLFGAAMAQPDWFAELMESMALVPEPLWWLLGAIVSFYFGARHQVKGHEFQKSIAETLAYAREVKEVAPVEPMPVSPTTATEASLPADYQPVASPALIARGDVDTAENAALRDWVDNQNGR